MEKFENTFYDLVNKYEPEKLSIVTETKKVVSNTDKKLITEEINEKLVYEDTQKLAEMSGLGTKTLNTYLNVKFKVMSQGQAVMLAKALTKKFGVEVTPEMLLKNVEE